jgi:hypothetical protein
LSPLFLCIIVVWLWRVVISIVIDTNNNSSSSSIDGCFPEDQLEQCHGFSAFQPKKQACGKESQYAVVSPRHSYLLIFDKSKRKCHSSIAAAIILLVVASDVEWTIAPHSGAM